MNESEYSRLFGSDVGSGRLPSANTFWGLLATSVGTDVEETRQRLLRAFETIPVELRTGYLRRLHSSTPSNAAGAWSELEFAALLQASRVEFVWIDAQEDSSHLRSLDFLLCERIHAEVTQFQENSVPDREMQLVRLVARGDLPTGTYTFTFGEGQPPVSKLRAALKSSPAGAPVEAVVGEWSIRQADQASPRTKVGDPTWMGDASGLIEKVKKAVRAKRRQARGAGARELVVSVVMLDRHARTLTDLLKENPSVLSEAIKSSGRVANELIVHGLVLGIVASDRFPPVPEWVVFAATDELLLRQLQAEYVGLPGGIQWP